MLKISVIIPAHNLEDHLERAVNAVLQQTLPPLEVLIVDNCSTDKTLARARELTAKHGNLVRVFRENQPGAPYARNLGLRESRGEWLQFLDGDDFVEPGNFDYQSRFATPEGGFIASGAINVDTNGARSRIPVMQNVWKGLFAGGGYLGYTSSILWNARAVRAVGGWNEQLESSQEYDLMFRILVAGYPGVVATEVHTVKYQRERGQISGQPYAKKLIATLDLHHRMLQYLLSVAPDDTDTLNFCFAKYFKRYTHFRVHQTGHTLEEGRQMTKALFTQELKRRYPVLRWLQFKSDLYLVLVRSKRMLFPPEK